MMFWQVARFWSLTCLLGVGLIVGTIVYATLCGVYFDMEVENHLKRAADANQPQLEYKIDDE